MDLKRRLYDKFVNQQGIFLSHTFSVVLAVRPGSLNSPLPSPLFERGPFAERTEIHLITRESEWRRIVSLNDGSKITLRILDTRSSHDIDTFYFPFIPVNIFVPLHQFFAFLSMQCTYSLSVLCPYSYLVVPESLPYDNMPLISSNYAMNL